MSGILADRYGYGSAFAAEWKRQWGSDLFELLSAPDGSVDQLWGDFALSANLRGREMALDVALKVTSGSPSLTHRRALDLGCGVGGTAVAMAELGAEVVGVDLDADRIRLATANATDHRVEAHFLTADVLDEASREGLGTFDVIVAEDVLEHVAEARQGVAAIADLLRPGGVARVTIPNGDAVPLVIADGHYLLPGLTLLDPATAEAYFDARFEWGEYDVGDYHSYDNYVMWFREAGLSSVAMDLVDPITWNDLDAQIAIADQAVKAASADRSLPIEVRDGLSRGWMGYEERLAEMIQRGASHGMVRVGARFWRFYVARGVVQRRFSLRPPPPWAWRTMVKRLPGATRLVRTIRR